MRPRILALVVLAAAAACGASADGPPGIAVDRTACSHCGMFVSEPAYAAASRVAGADGRVFDDIGCLLESLRREPRRESLRVWFQDAAGGGWVEDGRAVFVSAPSLRTPMGGGVIAYRDRSAAAAGAARHEGRVVTSFEELFQSARNTGRERAPGRPD